MSNQIFIIATKEKDIVEAITEFTKMYDDDSIKNLRYITNVEYIGTVNNSI